MVLDPAVVILLVIMQVSGVLPPLSQTVAVSVVLVSESITTVPAATKNVDVSMVSPSSLAAHSTT